MKRIDTFPTALIALYVLFLGYLFYGMYCFAHFKIDFSSMSAYDKARIAKLGDQIKQVGQLASSGAIPVRQIDTASVGFPEKERTLLRLHSQLELFATGFGRYPSQISELSRLYELPDYSALRDKSMADLIRRCEIVNLETSSYILSCDGFSLLSVVKKEELLKAFDGKTEKFYPIPGGVVLYVPPATARKL